MSTDNTPKIVEQICWLYPDKIKALNMQLK